MNTPEPACNISSPTTFASAETLAVFDFDGTLVTRDSFLPFLVRYARKLRKFRALLIMPFWLSLYGIRAISAKTVKEKVMGLVLAGQERVAIDAFAEAFFADWVQTHLKETVVQRLREHQLQGHRVVLLSASPDLYVPAMGRHLGIEETVCTRVIFEEDRCTGLIAGLNCKGEAKIAMLREYLKLNGAPGLSFSYGDSRSDLPLLRWVTHGYLVRGKEFIKVSPSV